ncbi:MAG TPA: response regulator, partial [Chitinivibrionales bacterium]
GMGIPASILPRLFDPFFTTQEKGNGLGLSTVYSIVKKHGGAITVDSTPGKGTTFFVFLPASEKNADDASSTPAVAHKGHGRILLMDDEASIRETVGGMLRSMGYSVDSALEGNEALKLFKASLYSPHPFDAVIMDLTVPGAMGGKEMIDGLRKLDAQVVALVSSGYSEDDVMAAPTKYGFTDKITKPFKKSELSELLNKYLPQRVS